MIFNCECMKFDWDEWNIDKNWVKHKVFYLEAEEVFFNLPFVIQDDKQHSKNEKRFYSLGRTNNNRYLFITFTQRKGKIRIVSARPMSKKESKIYEKIKSSS